MWNTLSAWAVRVEKVEGFLDLLVALDTGAEPPLILHKL